MENCQEVEAMEGRRAKACPTCGREVSEASKFCPFCRAEIAAEKNRRQAEAPECAAQGGIEKAPSSRGTNGPEIAIGIAAGAILAVFGAVTFFSSAVGCESTSFGGDAYTYIYRGIVASAMTLHRICQAVGMSMMCGGVAIACAFVAKIR